MSAVVMSESQMLLDYAARDLRDARYLIERGHRPSGALRVVTSLHFMLGAAHELQRSAA